MTDAKALRKEQYSDSSKLQARAGLHAGYSTNPQGWLNWLFEQLALTPGSQILELGCGPGSLWRENRERIPASLTCMLSDLSIGMAREARASLAAEGGQFTFGTMDAQKLPFLDDRFDTVIANHMLYHIADLDQALGEIYRVLKTGGKLYAATNGRDHLVEMEEMITRYEPRAKSQLANIGFNLENGAEVLGEFFARVAVRRYSDSLEVDEAKPLVDYILSMARLVRLHLGEEQREALTAFIEAELAVHGSLHFTKSPGLFIASKD
ncbi:MAG: class I SAM-dependent methyltransferase [Anaerolineae bacterium]|nr:class I SAM-dependent methyltransferase [Anaerolineae bacterium]